MTGENINNNLAKVADVLDDGLAIVINRGKKDGVSVGQRFLLYRLGGEVLDPDTRESLGNLEIIGGKAIVTHVQENMAILTSDEYEFEPRRVIKRETNMFYFGEKEEVIEPQKKIKPLSTVAIGDLAKRI